MTEINVKLGVYVMCNGELREILSLSCIFYYFLKLLGTSVTREDLHHRPD